MKNAVWCTQVIKNVTHVCDFCEQSCNRKCYGCDRDVCRSHGHELEYDPWSFEYLGEYPMVACPDCIRLLGLTRGVVENLHDAITELKESWLRDCRELRRVKNKQGNLECEK